MRRRFKDFFRRSLIFWEKVTESHTVTHQRRETATLLPFAASPDRRCLLLAPQNPIS
jgi:hypothetical protein